MPWPSETGGLHFSSPSRAVWGCFTDTITVQVYEFLVIESGNLIGEALDISLLLEDCSALVINVVPAVTPEEFLR